MPSHAPARGGLRPAEALPPTLQPNAVLLAAPPAARGLSLLGAMLVYSLIGSGLLLAAREGALHAPIGERWRTVVFEPSLPLPPPPVAPTPVPARTGGNGARPAGAEVLPLPAATDALPDTPSVLPSRDLGHAGQFTADMPVAKDGTGLGLQVAGPLPAPPAPAPVSLELKDVRVLRQVAPVYPALARAARIQGPVTLLLTVDEQGVPSEVRVLSGPHPALMNEAERVARQWRFEPARVDGRSVPAQFRLTVLFRLS